MTTQTTIAPALTASDDDTLDRAFLMQMARIPLIAVGFVLLTWLSSLVSPRVSFGATHALAGPVVLICLGMILAAVIDGWAFKVPNWLTLSLVLCGWMLGGLKDLGWNVGDFQGGFLASLGGTALGFGLLFPALFIGGMGQGDVKMQMGFGAWVAVIFGSQVGFYIVLYAFCIGVIIGGVFGLVIMAMRRQFSENAHKFKEIVTDLRVMMTHGPKVAADRAQSRRASWVRLPYGVPLCVGFVGYLACLYLYGG